MTDIRKETRHTKLGSFCFNLVDAIMPSPPCSIKMDKRFPLTDMLEIRLQRRTPYKMCLIGIMR